MRCIALGRRNWTFAGSDRGAERAAALHTPIETAELDDVDPRAWLADVHGRIDDHPASRLDELLPWNWKPAQEPAVAARRLPSIIAAVSQASSVPVVFTGWVLFWRLKHQMIVQELPHCS